MTASHACEAYQKNIIIKFGKCAKYHINIIIMLLWCFFPIFSRHHYHVCDCFKNISHGILMIYPQQQKQLNPIRISLPGEYSATGHRINYKGLALYNCHHCLLQSTHSHLGRVGLVGLMRVHSTLSQYCLSLRRPDSEICILVQPSLDCLSVSVWRPPIQLLTILITA